jgi:hypothetical protein
MVAHDTSELPAAEEEAAVPEQQTAPVPERLDVDPSLDDAVEPVVKRQKLEENHDPSLEDEAVLNALAAHNNPTQVEYATE